MASEQDNSQGSAQPREISNMEFLLDAGSDDGYFDDILTVTWTRADQNEARQLGNAGSPTSKRKPLSTGDHDMPKRRQISSGTSSSSTIAALKITKPTLFGQGQTAAKYYVPSSVSSQTFNPLSPQTIGASSSQTLDDPQSLTAHVYGGRNTAPRPQQKTTMNRLAPRLTEPSHHSLLERDEVLRGGSFAAPSASAESAEQGNCIVDDDEYPIDDDDEQAMLRLCNDVKTVSKKQFPPSSVADAWDRDSRTAEEYDPWLQHSSVQSTPDSGIEVQQSNDRGDIEEDLLDDDVDWDAVFAITSTIPKDDSLVGVRELEQRHKEAAANEETGEQLTELLPDLPQARPLSPFTRPPFPDKIRDRPSVTGLSSRAVLRVCFRVEELIQEATRCSPHKQEAIFELYASVTYSSREPVVKRQYFQFRDLFEDKQPFPSGTLSGWRPGSLLDQQSRVFLDTRRPKLCWMLSTTHLDSRNASGLTLDIIDIRETNWDHIRLAKAITCGEETETEAEETASVP